MRWILFSFCFSSLCVSLLCDFGKWQSNSSSSNNNVTRKENRKHSIQLIVCTLQCCVRSFLLQLRKNSFSFNLPINEYSYIGKHSHISISWDELCKRNKSKVKEIRMHWLVLEFRCHILLLKYPYCSLIPKKKTIWRMFFSLSNGLVPNYLQLKDSTEQHIKWFNVSKIVWECTCEWKMS